ncbi:hypothetical protein TYRP_020807 [Tyrophagus putrescentiae]|nr:hypothetical protein TYRP_020807 [Tyrophagus putrescentiae]
MEVPPSSSQSGGLFITPAQYNFMTAERELLRQQGCFSGDQRPRTSCAYLPMDISDGQLKLQFYNFKKDLQAARELVNNMKVARQATLRTPTTTTKRPVIMAVLSKLTSDLPDLAILAIISQMNLEDRFKRSPGLS